jgi:hypothetical protein
MFFWILTILVHLSMAQTNNAPLQTWNLTHLYFSGGNYSENDYGVQNSKTGSISTFSYAPYLAMGANFYLNQNINLVPEVGYVLQRNAESSAIKKDTFWLKSDFSFHLSEQLKLRLGTSIIMNSISGNGGEEELNNGNSKEEYYIPSDRRTAINQTVDLGIEYFLSETLSLKYTTIHYSFFNTYKEQISTLVCVSYYWKK